MPRKSKVPGGEASMKAARVRAEMEKRQGHEIQKPWWQMTGTEAAEAANGSITAWMSVDLQRQYDLSYFARMYGHADSQFAGSILSKVMSTGSRDRIVNPMAATKNGIQVVTNTVTNSVAQHRPVVQFAATDGDYRAHRIAKDRGRFVAGAFYEQDVYKKTAIQFRDSGVWGTGVLGVFDRCGRATVERVFPGDLFIDPASCLTNNSPPEMARVHLMDRHRAWMMFEGDKEAQQKIMDATEITLNVDGLLTKQSDIIQLNEFWRPATYRGAGDGHYLIATQTDPLEQKEWKRTNFPFCFIDCIPRLFGFWSQGMGEILENTQMQYNELSYSINEALQFAGRIRLFVNSTSNLVIDNITDEIGGILRGDGEPKSMLWQAVQPEVYMRLDALWQDFFDISGVSPLVAAPNPEQTDPREAAVAIRAKVGIYDERHALWTQSYQDAHLTIARLLIQTISEIIEEEKAAREEGDETEPQYQVYTANKPVSDPIDFADLKFEPDEEYILTTLPVNDLPTTIEGRIAAASDMVAAGWYDEATAREVFGAPFDVARVETLFNASRDYFSKVLDDIVEHGKRPPDPQGNDNLGQGLNMALQHLAYAKVRNVPASHIDELERYITAIKIKLDSMIPKAPAGAPAPAAPPQG